MKNRKKAAVYFGSVLLLAVIMGCGDSGKEPVPTSEKPSEAHVAASEEPTNSDYQASNEKTSEEYSQEDEPSDSVEKETAYLIGNVRSVGENRLIVSQAFEEEENVLAAPGEGSLDEVLISVYVSENTQYEVKTVKNRGVNGDADVETQEGAFSDLKEEVSVNISGYYEGENFWAEKITISLFV